MLLDVRGFRKKYLKFVMLAVVVFVALVVWIAIILSSTCFYEGISIDGLDISGMTLSDAKNYINEGLEKNGKSNRITLKSDNNEWVIGFDDIGYSYLVEEALDEAYSFGRKGNVFKRLRDIIDLKSSKKDIKVKAEYSQERLQGILRTIKLKIDTKPVNAALLYSKGKIEFKHDVIGRQLDIEKNIQSIDEKLLQRNFEPLQLEVDKIIPEIQYEEIKEISIDLSSFYTTFNSGDVNRTHNIMLACERINNTLIMPGQEFSMDKALGTRTVANGYREAPVIIRNELVEGIGGGVCQVTTTLYGAILRAKVSVTEKTPHSMPLGYVEPGQDATIAEGFIDFKFKNNLGYPVAIGAEVKGNRIDIKILGKKTNSNKVKLKSNIINEYYLQGEDIIIDDSLPDGVKQEVQKPRRGLKVAVYRYTYSGSGELLETEKLGEVNYKPVKGKYKVNSRYYDTTFDELQEFN